MSEETQRNFDPTKAAREWLSKLEALSRVKNFVEAARLFHKNCVYYGLIDDRRVVDFAECWKEMRNLSFDINQVKIIPEANLILMASPWVANSLIVGAPFKQGRLTVGLMRFSNEKLLCIHYHNSRTPEKK